MAFRFSRRAFTLVGLVLLAGCTARPVSMLSVPSTPDEMNAQLIDKTQLKVMSAIQRHVCSVPEMMEEHDRVVELEPVKALGSSILAFPQFKPHNAIDENLNTAWAPVATDTTPNLTVALRHIDEITAIAIDQTGVGVTFDVAISSNGGDFIPSETGLTSTPGKLQTIQIDHAAGDQVLFTFHTSNPGALRVNEIDLFGMHFPQPVAVHVTPTTVVVRDFEFVPKHLFVRPGTTVTWAFAGPSYHTTTADPTSILQWDSGPLEPGDTFQQKFSVLGDYQYHCDIHDTIMKGVISVR